MAIILAVIGCVCAIWGIIWGIFIRSFVWMGFIGLALMGVATLFVKED